jgi:hypothetical protein
MTALIKVEVIPDSPTGLRIQRDESVVIIAPGGRYEFYTNEGLDVSLREVSIPSEVGPSDPLIIK